MNLTRYIKYVLIALLVSIFIKVNAQAYKVYEPDSASIEKYEITYNRISGFYGIDFKDNLADGHWQYFSKKNSKAGDYDNYYLQIEGNYKDSLRHGKFIYYNYPYTKKKNDIKKEVYKYMNYSKGLLDGYFCIYGGADFKIREGTFNMGKKNGFFIDYVNGKVESISLYKNDSLKEKVIYHTYSKNTIHSYLSTDDNKEEILILYDSIGNVSSKAFFSNKDINKYQTYSSDGFIKEEFEGEFYPLKKYKNAYNGTYRDRLYERKLKNGIIRKYQNGILKEEEYYKDGKLEKTVLIKE